MSSAGKALSARGWWVKGAGECAGPLPGPTLSLRGSARAPAPNWFDASRWHSSLSRSRLQPLRWTRRCRRNAQAVRPVGKPVRRRAEFRVGTVAFGRPFDTLAWQARAVEARSRYLGRSRLAAAFDRCQFGNRHASAIGASAGGFIARKFRHRRAPFDTGRPKPGKHNHTRERKI